MGTFDSSHLLAVISSDDPSTDPFLCFIALGGTLWYHDLTEYAYCELE
jgi:hypothetical protein